MFLSLCPVKILLRITEIIRPRRRRRHAPTKCALGGPSVLPAPGSCGQQAYSRRRPAQVLRRSEHMHKTGTESGHMTGTNAGAIRVVHCRPQACQSFAAVRWLSSCRLCAIAGCSPSWWRVGCCGGLPPPGKGPSPAVWGEGLSRLSLDAGEVMRLGWPIVGLYGDIRGCVCPTAPTALPAASKAQPRRPSLRPMARSPRGLLRPLLF